MPKAMTVLISGLKLDMATRISPADQAAALDSIASIVGPAARIRDASVESYKCNEVVLLEELMRKAIRSRVIEIGVTKAHSIVRRRKPNMAGRRLSSIYSKNDAGPAVSLKELIATLSVLGVDPLDVLFEHLAKRRGVRESAAVRNYRRSLERLREEIESKRARRRKSPAEDHPSLLDLLEVA